MDMQSENPAAADESRGFQFPGIFELSAMGEDAAPRPWSYTTPTGSRSHITAHKNPTSSHATATTPVWGRFEDVESDLREDLKE